MTTALLLLALVLLPPTCGKPLSEIKLKSFRLGQGGAYRGVSCAVKVMLSAGLDRAALRELLLGPSLVHPNIVSTFTTRAAHLTNEFFDLLEGGRGLVGACKWGDQRDSNQPRTLEPVPIQSGDGFGDPQGLNDGMDPLLVLHQILHALGAETGKMVVIVVQEYCDRGTLDNAISKKIFQPNPLWGLRLARRTLLRTAGEVARGLLHLHDGGVVHGDLKPANILLNSSREDRRGFTAKLADFGLSHVLPDAVASLVTKSWGSVAYMAPEAFDGKVSRATDVWAFGVLLWEMLTGSRPYMGLGQQDVIRGIQNNTLKLRWPEGAPMTAGIIELGRRCLSFSPADRPAFDEIAEQLVAIERAIRAELLGPQSGGGGGAARASSDEELQQHLQQQEPVDTAVQGTARNIAMSLVAV
ncbi:hypothetical protein VOLCADRAFT_94590 [Volvox carteri f. nagariensis]|uniref:Protein kinase domain-containing protein n=1 Tax=Volvox carteri f. nagariensis TaxID=3068 RepID=D8U570_VOLCA|nr:uncharacterized protein VOLCADRAFT_94590 [Volvox carteri f. nagariensis]EFJ45098.1 hypothetical protein VOLCADRAFT_94590 [Volvox carteri f. nagariensis]|eukprot:XP_002953774.1 hypothetical protein VOLCADRAFT_94590 [Volvox carteri f. nagariensis]